MNSIIYEFGTEILTEKLSSQVQPVNMRYATLKRIGLEDSQVHRQEIKEQALQDFARFRYKESGEIFVIGRDGSILLSREFKTPEDSGFAAFYAQFYPGQGVMQYTSGTTLKLAVFQYYKPWDSFIGLTIEQGELYALKNLFIKVALMLLAAVLLSTILFTSIVQRLIITPLVRLTSFATQVSKGNFDCSLPGNYILELGILKTDILQMVATLRRKMNQTTAQLELIRERETRLDNALTALQESEQRYRTIYNTPSEAIFIINPEDGRILDANMATRRMFGYTNKEIQTLAFTDLSSGEPPYTQQEAGRRMQAALEKGPQIFEWLAQDSSGDFFWVEISLQETEIEGQRLLIGVIRNVHTRKMAEQELASEKERLSVTLRSIGDGVITTDTRGRIVLMNSVAEKLTGWRQFEAAGRSFPDVFHIIHQDTGEVSENPVKKILYSGKIIEPAEDIILIARDGSRKNIADRGAPINDQHSRTIGAVIVFRDITEEKKMEEELLKVKKLESVGILAGGIAHDFNNILVAILGNVSLARQRLEDRNMADSLLQNVEKATLRAKDLTSQLLTFSRGGEPVMETASLDGLIRDSAEFVLRGSNVKVTFDIPADVWLVTIDPGQISQVIQNIVLNAKQAMHEEGLIEITCRNCENCADGRELPGGKCVKIIITDNGNGIPEEVLPQIFDPYFTTRDSGSGLGLSICHSIIKKHGARISVDSTQGSGTTFTIQLPISSDRQKIVSSPEKAQNRAFSGKARILVMDDDPMIVELAKQMLEHLGHDVVTSPEGKKALALYARAMEENTPFDIVIMDLTIPGGMGGKKAIQKLLQIDPEARAIVSSGYSHDPVMADYRDYGFKSVIVKPYQVEDLAKAVQETLQSNQ
jgi:PAS domain S-box-containing protein